MTPGQTDEFSFALRPCAYGIGVFATHDIRKGTHLRLCGDDREEISHAVPREQVPEYFRKYCLEREDGLLIRPSDFGRLHTVWFLNHADEPNAGHRNYVYYALRNIAEGEEILIDYNSLGEPDATPQAMAQP